MKLTDDQLATLLHKTRHFPRRSAKRYLKDLGGAGSAEELDAMIAKASKSPRVVALADELDRRRHHTLSAVELGMLGQIAEMIACITLEMERQGLTQSGLAERCNITQPMLSEYLSGRRQPSLGNLAKIATALGCAWRLERIQDS